MPKLLRARAPEDTEEERKIRKLANSRHAPGDWIFRARIISLSWQSLRTTEIAEELGCHPKTVRTCLHRFNAEGIDGLGDRPGAGRKPRLTELERSRIIALPRTEPPGRLVRGGGGELEAFDEERQAHWTLDALTAAAQQRGIEVSRSQIRRILLREGVRWRNTRPWAESEDPARVRPKRARVVGLYTDPPEGSTVICLDELGPVSPRAYPPAPGWSTDGHRIKAPLEYSRGPEKVWVYGALRVEDGQALTLTGPSRNTEGYLRLLRAIEEANPTGDIYCITDNLASHKSPPIREWLESHQRMEQVFIPKGAAWLNLQEAWWRMFRREALAGQHFADDEEIELARRVATMQLNHQAKPWVWGRPPKPPRHRRRTFVYRF